LDILSVAMQGATQASDWEKGGVIVGAITAGLFLAVLFLQFRATQATEKAANASRDSANAAMSSADAAREANKMAAAEMDIRLRPWLFIGYPKIRRIESAQGTAISLRSSIAQAEESSIQIPPGMPDDAVAIYELPITNYGQLPAINVDTLVNFDLDQAIAEANLDEIGNAKRSIIPPSHTVPQSSRSSAKSYASFSEGHATGYFAVRVHYDDREGRSWRSESSFQWRGTSISPIFMKPPVQIDRE